MAFLNKGIYTVSGKGEPMRNTDGLIDLADRPLSERQEIGRLGGIRSGEVRRERRRLKEELDLLLRDGDRQERVCLALIERAEKGDTRAFTALRAALGEEEPEERRVEISGTFITGAEKVAAIREYLTEFINPPSDNPTESQS